MAGPKRIGMVDMALGQGAVQKRYSGKKKAHKHKLFGPVAPGTTTGLSQGQTQFVPGTSPGCPWDKPGFSPYFTQWKPSLSQGQT